MNILGMKIGSNAKIIGYNDAPAGYRAKLLALGLTREATIKLIGIAPMGDPIRLSVRGFELSLRKAEATVLQLQEVVE